MFFTVLHDAMAMDSVIDFYKDLGICTLPALLLLISMYALPVSHRVRKNYDDHKLLTCLQSAQMFVCQQQTQEYVYRELRYFLQQVDSWEDNHD